MNFYDHAQHHADTGHALFDLAVAGNKTQSAPRLAYAIAHHLAPYARTRAMTQIKLATLLMATTDPRHAITLSHRALDAATQLRSHRATDDLRNLHRYAGRHTAIPGVPELRDRIILAIQPSTTSH